jgi:hypothetical protein
METRQFDRKCPTLWLLEGFTGYLERSELDQVMASLADISAIGSRLIATFVGEDQNLGPNFHRFRTNDPLGYVRQWGWDAAESRSICEYGRLLNRPLFRDSWEGYQILTAAIRQQKEEGNPHPQRHNEEEVDDDDDDLLPCQRDAYKTSSRCTVLSCERKDALGTFFITLDNCYLYPEGGGQPSDNGTVNGRLPVLSVSKHKDSNRVVVELDEPLELGFEVDCEIDWGKRFDHMQQHTAQVRAIRHAYIYEWCGICGMHYTILYYTALQCSIYSIIVYTYIYMYTIIV